MRVGILGSGLMGGKLRTLLARAGHEVVFSSEPCSGFQGSLALHGTESAPPQFFGAWWDSVA